MANEIIKSKFITVNTDQQFKALWKNNQISSSSIVFIKDTGEIWLKDRYYGSVGNGLYILLYNPSNPYGPKISVTSWTDLECDFSGVSDGSYIIQVLYDNCIYTGYMSLKTSDGSAQTWEDEIVLHVAGKISDGGRLFLKLVHKTYIDENKLTKSKVTLYASISNPLSSIIDSNTNTIQVLNLTINIKKLL